MEDASCVGLSFVVDDSNSGWVIMEDKLFGNADSDIKRGDLHTSRVVTEDESEPYRNAALTRRMMTVSRDKVHAGIQFPALIIYRPEES
jgi:hypothetical protein